MTAFSSLYGARLNRELGTDDVTVLFTTALRKSAINEAQEEFAEITECLQRQTSVTITGGTAEYNLNSTAVIPGGDFLRFSKEQVQVRYTDASSNVTLLTGLDLPLRQVGWLNIYTPGWQLSTVASSVQQFPSAYYERMDGGNRYLGFTPVPSTGSSASMEAIVPYLARPTPLSSDTSEPFTVNSSVRADLRTYHQALVHYAAHQLEKLRRDDAASDRQLQRFLTYVSRFLGTMRTKGGRQARLLRTFMTTRSSDRGTDPRR